MTRRTTNGDPGLAGQAVPGGAAGSGDPSASTRLGATAAARNAVIRAGPATGLVERPGCATTGTPSSARNRDGWAPPSTGSATAVATSIERARVHATYMSRRSSASRSR